MRKETIVIHPDNIILLSNHQYQKYSAKFLAGDFVGWGKKFQREAPCTVSFTPEMPGKELITSIEGWVGLVSKYFESKGVQLRFV